MRKSNYFPPYTDGRPTLKTTGAGVYVIKKNKEIVYVGSASKNLKKTLYRHFQKWTDKRPQFKKDYDGFDRVTYYGQDYSKFLVRVIFTKTAEQAYRLEEALIKKYEPEQNTSKVFYYTRKINEVSIENFNEAEFISKHDEEFFRKPIDENEEVPF